MTLQKKYGIEELISLTKKDIGLVNDLIIQRTISNTDMIPKVSQYLISSGGKRLRPMLTIASEVNYVECKNNYYIPGLRVLSLCIPQHYFMMMLLMIVK